MGIDLAGLNIILLSINVHQGTGMGKQKSRKFYTLWRQQIQTPLFTLCWARNAECAILFFQVDTCVELVIVLRAKIVAQSFTVDVLSNAP